VGILSCNNVKYLRISSTHYEQFHERMKHFMLNAGNLLPFHAFT
jgi:hypothetical protein